MQVFYNYNYLERKEAYKTISEKSMPYFMENEEWFYWDKEEWRFKLTDKAPKEAIESYKEFYSEEIWIDENGDAWMIS